MNRLFAARRARIIPIVALVLAGAVQGLATTGPAGAASDPARAIGIDLTGDLTASQGLAPVAPGDVMGVVAQANWNSTGEGVEAGSRSGVVNASNQTLGGVSVSWSFPGDGWSENVVPGYTGPGFDPENKNFKLMGGLLFNQGGPGTVTVAGLDSALGAGAKYDVIAYVDPWNLGFEGQWESVVQVGGNSRPVKGVSYSGTGAAFDDATADGVGNFVRFIGLTGNSVTVTAAPAGVGDPRGTAFLNGLQIVPDVQTTPQPTTTTTTPTTTTTTTQSAPPPPARSGYWLVGRDGAVFTFGDVANLGSAQFGGVPAVDIEATPSGNGYWIVSEQGAVQTFGDATPLGNVSTPLEPGERVTSLSATGSGQGYWIFTTLGRAIAFGNAVHRGDMLGTRLNGPVLDSIATPSDNGYYMVASDGGVFSFGDAEFHGSMGDVRLNAPVESLVPDGDGEGYWLVASDGGVFAFKAPFVGSLGDLKLNQPVTGMIRYGNGYLLVATDGGVFVFSDRPFSGSLGDNPPASPIVAVTALD